MNKIDIPSGAWVLLAAAIDLVMRRTPATSVVTAADFTVGFFAPPTKRSETSSVRICCNATPFGRKSCGTYSKDGGIPHLVEIC